MKRLSALLTVAAMLLLLTAWTFEDCVEVNFDHPDCDQYTTTTQPEVTTTTAEVTTTTAEVTTTTAEVTTTTQPTVTTGPPPPPPTTATTVEQCPPGTVHQPPLCVTTTIPHFDTTTTASVLASSTRAELPRTGIPVAAFASFAVASGLLGKKFLKWARRPD